MIQQVGLFPHMTVARQHRDRPAPAGLADSDADQRTRAAELLELVGPRRRRTRSAIPAQLSGGQRQRVGLARALAADPPLMLMDEPFGALDPITRDRLQDEFLRLHEEVRKTVIFVTHDIDEAIKLGDRIAILREGGVLAQYDTPDGSSRTRPTTSSRGSSAPTAGSSGWRCVGSTRSSSSPSTERAAGRAAHAPGRRPCATRSR